MKEVFDYLASLIIGGTVTLTLVGFQAGIRDAAATQATNAAIQQDFTSLTNVIEYDIRKLGYRCSDSVDVIRADSTTFVFKGDINNDGIVETVKFYLGDSSTCVTPGVSKLFRMVDTQPPLLLDPQVTLWRLAYYDGQGNQTSNLGKIRSIRVSLTLQSGIPVDGSESGVCWERIITPLNLR